MQSVWSTLFLGAFTVVFVQCVAEVYDVTTIHKFDVQFPNNHDQGILKYVPPCDLDGDGCSEWNVTGWTRTNPDKTETSIPLSGFFISAFSLSEYSGVMSAETEANGSVVCLSLTYYLQPNSGASIKVLMENEYHEVIVVGTATAPLGDIQPNYGAVNKFLTENEYDEVIVVETAAPWLIDMQEMDDTLISSVTSMTTQQFILEVEPNQWTHVTYKIQAKRNLLDQTVLISAVSACSDRDFPDFRTIGERGTTEIHAMTNARGLPILLPNDTTLSSYVGVDMEECISLDGGCNWNVSTGDWRKVIPTTKEFPPLRLSEKKNFTVYTFNNISTYYMFPNKLNFKLREDRRCCSEAYIEIFLMANNHSVLLGDMYYIQLQSYDYYSSIRRYTLRKCTSDHGDRVTIHGDQRFGCDSVKYNDINIGSTNVCDFKIQFSAGVLTLTSVCQSEEQRLLQWEDPDPLDIVYYRFGSWEFTSEFYVHTDDPFVWSLRSEEGSFTSPAFLPSSNTLCVSLTYYLPLTADNSLHVSIHWPGGDKQDFDSIEAMGEWKTVRLTAPIVTAKLSEQMTVELKGKKTENSEVFIQRISGCSGEGFEDVLVLSQGDVNIQNIGYDVAVVQSGNKNSTSSDVSCANGGVFDMEYGSCVCPAGFTGTTCEKGCGANRYGASCEALCSKTKEHCQRMVLCRPKLGCNCASGLKGILCNTYCDFGEYGTGCKQKCGHCANLSDCDKYTGECPHGCDPGYYPPFCQEMYKYLSIAPVVSAANVEGFKVTANLNDSRGKGTPTFYQLQYREYLGGSNLWQELEPLPLFSRKISDNVTGLKAGIDYEVRVILLDRDGNSYQDSDVPYAKVTTLCTVPDSINYDLQAVEISEDSFQISWKFVSKSPIWCEVTAFEVEHKDGVRWLKLYQGKETTTRVSNLLPGQQYQVRVRALSKDKAFPFSDVVLIITKVGAPEKVYELRVVSGMNHDTEVDWTPPLNNPRNIHQYKITYQCQKLLACKNEDCGYSSGEVEATAPPIVLRNLLSFAQYTISISALAASWGPSKQLLFTTDMREPGVAPELNATMSVSDRTNSSFAVHWQPPHNCTFLNGYLYKYQFQLIDHNSSTLLREGITHLTSATFNGLMPLTMYTVRVYLVTSGGWNPKHPLEIPAWTRATTPDRVEHLVVYKKGRRMIGLRWAAPKQMYGPLKSFVVSYQLPEQDQQIVLTVKPTPCPAWPHLYCHTINGLQPDTQYSVVVQAQNVEAAGVGEPASLTAVTKETAPLSPSDIHVVNQTQTNLTVEWGPPDMLNGVLRSFLVTIEEIESFNSSACCEYFPVQELAVQSEKMNYRLEFSGLRPASSYAVSVSAKTIALGPAVSITAHTRPPIPSMANAIEIPGNVTYLSDGSTTIHIHPLTEYQDLIRGYLLLVLPESNESNTSSTVFFDEWLTKEVEHHVNGIYYFAAEFDQVDLEENSAVVIGSGHGLKVGKWGEIQDPKLENMMGYRFGLVITLEYCGVHSVGYTVTDVLHVDY